VGLGTDDCPYRCIEIIINRVAVSILFIAILECELSAEIDTDDLG